MLVQNATRDAVQLPTGIIARFLHGTRFILSHLFSHSSFPSHLAISPSDFVRDIIHTCLKRECGKNRQTLRNRVSQHFSRGKVVRRGSRGEKFEGSRARCVLPLATPPRDIKSYLRLRYVRTLSIGPPMLDGETGRITPEGSEPRNQPPSFRSPSPLAPPLCQLSVFSPEDTSSISSRSSSNPLEKQGSLEKGDERGVGSAWKRAISIRNGFRDYVAGERGRGSRSRSRASARSLSSGERRKGRRVKRRTRKRERERGREGGPAV